MNVIDNSAFNSLKSGENETEDDYKLRVNLLKWLAESEGSTCETAWRDEAKEDYDFYAGKQDTEEVLEKLAELKRPASVYNEIKPKIDMLVGVATQSRRAPYAFPVEVNDESITELINGTLKYSRKESKLARNEIECFDHTVKSGRSLLHFYIDDETPFEPEIRTKRIAGRDFRYDPLSVEYDYSDARYLFVDKWYSEDAVKSLFPELDVDEIKSLGQSGGTIPLFYSTVTEKYRITECWYRKYEKVYWVINPLTRRPEALTQEEFVAFRKTMQAGLNLPDGTKIPPTEVEAVTRDRFSVYYAIFSSSKIIRKGKSPYKHNYFPYIFFGAYRDEDENRWFGAINMMKDPQRGLNTMRRQLSHLLQTAPKGMLIHEVGAVLDIEAYESNSSDPTYHMEVSQGAISNGRIRFTEQPQISPVYAQLIGFDEKMLKDTSGIQDSLMGQQTSSREPGVTVRMRQETGLAVLYILFDNFRESRLLAGKILLSMVQQYYTNERIIRIEGEEGNKLLQINSQKNPNAEGFNDVSVGKYDLVIDEAIDNQTMRMATLQMLVDYSQQNPNTIPPELILEYSDLPASAKNKVKEYYTAQQEREYNLKVAAIQNESKAVAEESRLKELELNVTAQIAELNASVKMAIEQMKLGSAQNKKEERSIE